jgi:hypothetical protein
MKPFVTIFVIMFILYVAWFFLFSTLVIDLGNMVVKNGGLGATIGKEIHNFNKAVEGK